MVELLAYLRANGFTNYIASGGGRDFMRPISDEVYGIPREGVIGSAVALAYTPDEHGGAITRQMAADYLDDGPEKPVHIWTRTGRRPVLAAGNSNGDIEMLDFTQHPDKPSLRLLVLHDDAEREFDYVSGCRAGTRPSGRERMDGRQHQERLGDGVLIPRPDSPEQSAPETRQIGVRLIGTIRSVWISRGSGVPSTSCRRCGPGCRGSGRAGGSSGAAPRGSPR